MAPELPSSSPHLRLRLLRPADGSLRPCSALPRPTCRPSGVFLWEGQRFAWQRCVGIGRTTVSVAWSLSPPWGCTAAILFESHHKGRSPRLGGQAEPVQIWALPLWQGDLESMPSFSSLSVLIAWLGLHVSVGEASTHSKCSTTCPSPQPGGGRVLGGRRVPGAGRGPSGAEGPAASSTAPGLRGGVPPFHLTPKGFGAGRHRPGSRLCRSRGRGLYVRTLRLPVCR